MSPRVISVLSGAAILAVIMVAVMVLLAGCSAAPARTVAPAKPAVPKYESQYPKTERGVFMHDCENAGAPAKACACAINWWMSNVPYKGYLADGNYISMGIDPPDLVKVTAACRPR